MKSPTYSSNPQDKLIDSLEGIYLTDAGAGTGKTYSIIKRYQNIIDKGVKPEEILLITFTRNAAEQMKEEVIGNITGDKISITDLLEAPIMNFHSLCSRILKADGSIVPEYLGINETLSANFNIIEDTSFEPELFRKFYHIFEKEHLKKYEKIFQSLDDDTNCVLYVIKKLSSHGIFPTQKGWFNEGEILLKGNYEKYLKKFENLNSAAYGKKQEIQNKLYKILHEIKVNLHIDYKLSDMTDGNRAHEKIKDDIFQDELSKEILEFIREIYHSYIEYLLKKNYLNYDFLIMFAFLLLYNDGQVMKENQYEYLMVDEFQDTDEIQFQLIMMLVKEIKGKANFCVVGDWKQGIYGFRNTTIENITEFSERLEKYKNILNKDRKRIAYDITDVNKITFEFNYRSSQKILNFSRQTLFCIGKKDEEADFDKIDRIFPKPLTASRKLDDITDIKFYQANEEKAELEIELILKKISELVNENYIVREFDPNGKIIAERKVIYSDICILSRTNIFGLNLQKAGMEKGIPVNYEGGLELFASQQAILVLAWLRIMLDENSIEGWIPVLEKEGYNYNEIYNITRNLNSNNIALFNFTPKNLLEFRNKLITKQYNIIFIVGAILNRYGFNDEFAYAIIKEISKLTKSDLISIGELINILNSSIDNKFDIEINKSVNAVVTQTIHLAKGLEYPVVIVANINRNIFPNTINKTNNIFYHPVTGIRLRKQYHFTGKYNYIFNNWRSDLLVKMFRPDNYDEERRLLYVAVTRAKQYLYFTSYRPSQFFEALADKTENEINKDFDYEIKPVKEEKRFESEEIKLPEFYSLKRKFKSVHKLMNDEGIEIENIADDGSTTAIKPKENAIEYGIKLHQIAHKIANGYKAESDNEDIIRLNEFISGLNANELKSEVDFLFPRGDEVIRGTIDLLAFYDDRIDVIDYKTDINKANLGAYKSQINIYKDVIKNIYPLKNVNGKIFFVCLDEIINVE